MTIHTLADSEIAQKLYETLKNKYIVDPYTYAWVEIETKEIIHTVSCEKEVLVLLQAMGYTQYDYSTYNSIWSLLELYLMDFQEQTNRLGIFTGTTSEQAELNI